MPTPSPPADAARDASARARRRRGLEEPLDFAVHTPGDVVVLRVRNPLHGTQYLLYLPAYPSREWALCTCPDFARRGLGTCKHLEGAARWIDAHPLADFPAPAPGGATPSLWPEIDRRRAATSVRPLDGRALRAIGAALFDVGSTPTA